MKNSSLLKIAVMGTVVSAVCCFTPLLVIVFGALGLSAAIRWLDFILLPALIIFIGLTLYALARHRKLAKKH